MKTTKQAVLVTAIVAAMGLMWMGNMPTADAHPDYGCKSCHVPHNAYNDDAVPLWNPDHAEIGRASCRERV